jgi:high-affinity nickel-transport protein
MCRLRPDGEGSGGLGVRIASTYAGLFAFHLVVWGYALWIFRAYPALLGDAVLAYTLGLRHAVDADHIAAIDNVTRKLMQAGQRPVTVGLFFSLGHSSVVILAFILLALAASDSHLMQLRTVFSVVGVSVSAAFLFAIALVNGLSLRGVWRAFRQTKRTGRHAEDDLDQLMAGRGLIARLLRPAFALVGESWHMYPLGALFGLGFDTATEVGMLGLSAAAVTQGAPLWSLIVLPALFTAAMTLVDTTDSVLMLGAYGWAFVNPVRKLYYNLAITLISVLVAVVIGLVEVLSLIGQTFGLDRGAWRAIAALNNNFGLVGYLIIGVFVVGWIASALMYWLLGYDRLEIASE